MGCDKTRPMFDGCKAARVIFTRLLAGEKL
jgi:hypothetical protein